MLLALFVSVTAVLILLLLILLLSSVRISINKFELTNNLEKIDIDETINKIDQILKTLNTEIEINIKLLFLFTIPILSLNFNKNRILKIIKNEKFKARANRYAANDLINKNNIDYLKYMKLLKPRLGKFTLNMNFGTEDAVITSFVIAFIASGIAIVLSKLIKKFEPGKYKYEITPVYINKNVIEIGFNCIFKVKMIHIIHIIYLFLKKRRVDKNERASNRRTYDYSYE